MKRSELMSFMFQHAGQRDAFDRLEEQINQQSRHEHSAGMLDCGIIPEMFQHDSAEEKLWAKYCDMLLCSAFNHLGIQAEVIRTRGDSADVLGRTDSYSIVGDAKAFRLSRTAKNQKDFKVQALDDWRKKNTFACLVAPLYQYPARRSQVYVQAKMRNVTLLSYMHLRFLLDWLPEPGDLSLLWQVAGSLEPDQRADAYWNALDAHILAATRQEAHQLQQYKAQEATRTRQIGQEGITHWEDVKGQYQTLSREAAIQRLIEHEGIEKKIQEIQRTLNRLVNP